MSADWSSGYMRLGGNLGRAIVGYHQAKPKKPARIAKSAHRAHREKRATVAHYSKSPSFLIAESLDQSGLNIGTLRLRPRGL
jgi:hypothetical protein